MWNIERLAHQQQDTRRCIDVPNYILITFY